ncbi:MAG TPA: hypothetical protein VHL58_19760 [Thermoanaerobaculia bacterium]|nr:hypothetical protein [Thermoanaerobaculia bacterium]
MNDREAIRPDWRLIVCGLAVLSLTSVTHLALFRKDTEFRYPDSTTYFMPAEQMLLGNGFADAPGIPDTIRTPGYPAFLAVCRFLGLNDRQIVLVQHGVCIAFSLVIIIAGVVLTRSRLAATTAGLIYAIDPTTLRYSNLLLTESLFTILLFLIVFLTARALSEGDTRRVAVIGILSGLLSILRPAALFYPFVLLFILMVRTRQRRARIAAVFLASAAIVPFAWMSRNAVQTGVFVFCSISGTNLLMHRAAGALAMEDGGDFAANLTRHQNELLAPAQERLRQRYGVAAFMLPHAVQGREYGKEARPVILEHLPAYARLTIRGLGENLFSDDAETLTSLNDSALDDGDITSVVRFYTGTLLVLALAGGALLSRKEAQLAMLLIGTIFYFVLIAAGAEAESRFRAPVVPQMALLAGLAVASAAGRARRLIRLQPIDL